ncbi:phenylacetate--CoA ligase family protein [Pseudomonas sp. UL073]|uniref:Phenylacetate--CoA ligase family protein n=1 Tax=Zestomonas insulae TaxID=2809017 RepID=A0ABS2IL14_9GAMM|nr:AMP-binding protein [Pseudomonas insulae]MBM7063420.1 phenylacetate--CoA ligase family protein [Pseudomonas insulae]
MSVPALLPGMAWPALPANSPLPLAALLEQLEALERAPLAALVSGQERQLALLNQHLVAHSPWHRQRLLDAGLDPAAPLTLATLAHLPPIDRRELQAAGAALRCAQVPRSHLPVGETSTSGSSGVPVTVWRSALNQLFWLAYTMREHRWWQRDVNGRLAIIRAGLPQERIQQDNWGPPASLLGPSGPAHAFSISVDTVTLAGELAELDPHYLLIYPAALADLVRHFRQHGGGLAGLREVRTIGETLSNELRNAAREVLGVEIVDCYSSQEFGVIAVQCPHSGLYHLMAENLIVEVLNDEGQPCRPGESGKVVITDLHNLATPLVRYAVGDHAEVGPPCSCGRHLPTLRRVLGRTRNMVLYPDGSRRWPLLDFHLHREVAPVQQSQLVQHAAEAIEARLVVERPLTASEEAAIAEIICDALGHPFHIEFRYFAERLPLGSGGKFEEFMRTYQP